MANTGWSTAADAESEIKKKAFLIKIKTSRKKFFVLREKSPSGPARLEYYDSEKKFRSGVVTPKRCIVLKNCLSISSKSDLRHPFAIYLYTRDNYFGVAFANEATQQDWLTTMLDLRSMQEENTLTKPLFEHIWPVKMTTKALGLPTGPYHLCLTNTEISLLRLNHDDPPVVLPLDCIRRCGHSHGFFFLDAGRSASTGAGELWLQIEDTVIAQNIHEATLNAMRNNPPHPIEPYRARTRSNADSTGKKNRPSGNQPPAGGGRVPIRSNSVSGHNELPSAGAHGSSAAGLAMPNLSSQSSSVSGVNRLDLGLASSIDENDAGYPSSGSTRSMTPDDKIDEEPSSYFSMDAAERRPQANATDVTAMRCPPDGVSVDYMVINPVAQTSTVTKTSQTSSSYMPMPGHSSSTVMRSKTISYPDASLEAGRLVTRSATTSVRRSAASTVSSSPATSVSEYMEMACPVASSGKTNAGEHRKSTETCASDTAANRRSTNTTIASSRSTSGGGTGAAPVTGNSNSNSISAYVMMKSTDEGYMDMKAGHLLDEKAHGSSSSVSSVVSLTSGTVSSVTSSRSGAVESEPAFHSLSRLPEITNDGYMEMSAAQNVSCLMMGMRLDVVRSFLRDDDVKKDKSALTGGEDFPKRAYSVGSKPSPDLGGRQVTTGSYVDMSGTGSLLPGDYHLSLKKEAEKSNSAPHLNDESSGQNTTVSQHTAVLAGEGGDLFMELDFNKKGSLMSMGRDFRDRASSGGSKDFRSLRTLSHGARDNLLSRISFLRAGDKTGGHTGHTSHDRRPRTSTICQESLRPRTSSFGANIDDARPRSSSGGNARLCDVFGQDARVGAWRPAHGVNSSMSSKQISVNSSVDSLGAGADYTDMCPGRVTNNRTLTTHPSAITRAVEDDYMSMKPGEETKTVSGNSDYMPMAPVALSKQSSDALLHLPQSSSTQVRKLSSSSKGESSAPATNTTTTTTPSVVYSLFEFELSPTNLHYAAPDPALAGTQSVTVPSAMTVTNFSSAAVPSRTSDVSNSNNSAAATAAAVTVVKSRIVSPVSSADADRGSRHVYAEIDFTG